MKRVPDFEKLQAAREDKLEQKKKLLEKIYSKSKNSKPKRKNKKTKNPAKENILFEEGFQPQKPWASILPKPLESKASFPVLLREHDDQPVHPSDALYALIELYRYSSEHRSRHIAMCWPAEIVQAGLVHALGTMQNQANGDKVGIRGALFPCKANVFYALNHLCWNTDDILEIVRRNAEDGIVNNNWVARGNRDKDPFLFSVSELKKTGDPNFHPALTDMMPHFYSGASYSGWADCSHRLLGNILARVRRRNVSQAFRKTASEVMGSPSSAPDAIFAIDGRLPDSQLKRAITDLYTYALQPDVVLITWSLKTRLEYPNWKAITTKLVKTIDQIAGENKPGIVCITDDPRTGFQLRDNLYDMACRSGSKPFQLHAVASRVGGDSLVIDQPPLKETRPLTFDLQLVDSDADRLCRDIYRVAKNNDLDTLDNNPLAEVIGLVSRVSSLPCGLRDLDDEIREGEISERTARFYRWLDIKAAVQEYLKTAPLKADASRLRQDLDKVSDIMGRAHEATNFGLRLAKLATHAAGSTHVMLVFESEFRCQLARRFLSRYTGYPEELDFEELRPRLHFIMARDLELALKKKPQARVVFVGLNNESTKIILCSNSIPNHTIILNTHRSALFLRGTLRTILDHFEETYRPLKTRMNSLIDQTPDGSESISFMSQPSVKMPDLRIELSDAVFDGQDLADQPNAWLIRLDNHRLLRRLPEQRVFIYDPLSEGSSGHGFKEREVRDLKIGDHLFVMSAELRFELDELLHKHDIHLRIDDENFEVRLRAYHQRVHELLKEKFPELKLTEQVRALRSQILAEYPQYAELYPQPAAMRTWINLKDYLDRPIEELRPFAPAREAYFKAFALTLGMDETQAAVFWSRVIQPFRFARRTGGRKLSDGYTTLLLEPEHLMSLGQIARREIESLTIHAREHTFVVDDIQRGQRRND
ncbi:hypothetical protein [Chromohalobacter sp.]|uniref:hypothetical protein n=1 Tax=Chromohalobacter sp. TaxID=50740 RepID=UPI0032427B25